MRTGRVLLGFVLLGGCGDDGVGATETTLTSSSTTMVPVTTSGTTMDAPTTSSDPSTSTGPVVSTSSETTVDLSTSSGTTMGVDPSTTSTTTTTTTTTTTGEPETTTTTTTGDESSSGSGEGSSSGGESSTGEIVVCPPPKPDSMQCEACLEMNCCQEYDACFADVKCTCIFNCIFSGQGPMGCAFTCMNMGMQNPTLGAMFICGDECNGCPW